MCLYTKKTWKTRETAIKSSIPIAKEDIKVYKVLTLSNLSPCQYFKYQKGKTYKANIQRRPGKHHKNYYYFAIFQGLHTCVTKLEAKRDFNNGKIVEMIIPKGSKYYIGTHGDIVSNKLKWPKNAKQWKI